MNALLAQLPLSLPSQALAFALVLARVGAAMVLLPGLGEAAAPGMLRAGLALALTMLLLPGLAPAMPVVPEASLALGGMIMAEVCTGLWFGWLARLLAQSLPVATQFIAYLMGLSSVLQPDAELGPQSTALARAFELAMPLLLLITGLYRLPVAALAGLYELIPAGTLVPVSDGTEFSVQIVGDAFLLALRLASPFVVAGMIWNLTVGLVARLMPRLQIHFVTVPGQILGGLTLLSWLAGSILFAWQEAMGDALAKLPGLP